MGVHYYRIKEKYLKKLNDVILLIEEEKKKCIYSYNGSSFFKTKYDLDYYLANKCDKLNLLYKQADTYLKFIV